MRIGNIIVNTTMQSILDSLIMDCNNSGKKLFSKGYKEINGYYIVQCPYHKFGQEHKPSAQFRATDGYFYCFAADTKIITHTGIYKIGSLVNQKVEILNGNGEWEYVTIKDCGIQQLYELNLSKDRNTQKIFTTKEHIWFDKQNKEYTTINLKPNTYLKSIFRDVKDFTIDVEGIRHGLIFGDGWRSSVYKQYGSGKHRITDKTDIQGYKYILSLYNNSGKHHLKQWFENDDFWKINYCTNNEIRIVSKRFDIDPKYKELPDISKGRDYIMSFLAGYIAADGNGTQSISTTNPDIVDNLLNLFIYCDISIKYVRKTIRKPNQSFDKNGSTIYTITYIAHNIPKSFFINKNKQPIDNNTYHRDHWKVESVIETDKFEHVYCCSTSTNSFVLFGNILTHNCFGCKESHPLPQVIYDCLGVDGRAWLLEHFDGDSDESRQGFGFKKRNTEEQNFVNPDILKRFDKTHPYMFQRKLNMEIIKKFNIGYDEEHKCITFPVKDLLGRIVFIATRSVEKKFFHYPSDVDKPIYGLYEIYEEMKNGKQIDEVYICESMFNALTLWCWGKYAVALNGTGSSTQLEILKKSSIRHFILALDNDNAGKKGTEKLIKELKGNKILEKINFKDERDVNDLSFEEFSELIPEKVTLL